MQKKKRRVKKWVIFLIMIMVIIGIFLIVYFGMGKNIRNIYVVGNDILTDQELIEIGSLENYPNFYTTTSKQIENKIKNSPYIEDIKVKKGFLSVYLYVKEKKPMFIYEEKIVFSDKSSINNDKLLQLPILINYVPDVKYDSLIKKMLKTEDKVLNKISEIKYDPNKLDEDRFLLYMNDQNYVYVTLTKFDLLNKYNDTVKKLDGKKGILYLDSGNYFKIKK